jgi:hypothetical protein
VSDTNTNRVLEIDQTSGVAIRTFDGRDETQPEIFGGFSSMAFIRANKAGTALFVGDFSSYRVTKLDLTSDPPGKPVASLFADDGDGFTTLFVTRMTTFGSCSTTVKKFREILSVPTSMTGLPH